MNYAAIMHRPTLEYIYPQSRNELYIQITLAKKDIKDVKLVWWFRNDTSKDKLHYESMELACEDLYHDYYSIKINTLQIAAYVRYYFLFDNKISYAIKGFKEGEPEFNENFFEFLWPNIKDGHQAPEYANKLIYYQIFTERFSNGNNNITPKNSVPWGSKPTRENFCGGDIKGIIDKLDYIYELGINCIYLTPLFFAPSNHKYDTIDYYEIDPSFGCKDDLRKLVTKAHEKGIKVILDGVFNHSGYYWPQFQDVVLNGKNSKYADWFFVNEYPVSLQKQNYDCVGHYKWMPKLNLENKEVAEYFIKVGEYWISEFDIDGWRLDVADEVSTIFWQKFSDRIKAIKRDAILLGETWSDAGKLINNDRLDSAMNYIFRDALVDFIAKETINVSEFNNVINKMLSLYPREVALRLYNPLDSHDTSRFLRECNEDIDRLSIAVALQMTLPGCPAIFYGDEIGLSGDNDPGCRLCMNWDETAQNKKILDWYKKLINIRKNTKALYEGDFHAILCDDNKRIYIFERNTNDESVVVVINTEYSDFEISVPINLKGYKELIKDCYITEDAYSSSVKIAANSVHIYKKGEQ